MLCLKRELFSNQLAPQESPLCQRENRSEVDYYQVEIPIYVHLGNSSQEAMLLGVFSKARV